MAAQTPGIRTRHSKDVRHARQRPLQLRADVRGVGVFATRPQEDSAVVPDAGGGARVAHGRAEGCEGQNLRAPQQSDAPPRSRPTSGSPVPARAAFSTSGPSRTSQPSSTATSRLYGFVCCRSSGDRKLADIDLADLLELKEELLGEGHSGSTIRNSFVPLQALYRRARRNGTVPINPAVDLDLPTSGRRDRAATPAQAAELLDVLPEFERALWATAFYAGLRRGELRGLHVRDVDFDSATLSVGQSWDIKVGPILPNHARAVRTACFCSKRCGRSCCP